MIKIISVFCALFFAFCSPGQKFEGFEGEITYANSYKSKVSGMSDQQFTGMMGATQHYFIKGGNYKSVSDGSFMQWQLYVNKDNKLYTKMANSEVLLWYDGAENKDEVVKAELNKNVTEVLGYKCDELILTCKSSIQKYYFSTQLPVDPQLFVNHKYGNWYNFLLQSKSLPLKTVFDNAQFTLESVATGVKATTLDASFFALPANAQTAKSPY